MAKTRFKRNHREVQRQILYGEGVDTAGALRRAAGPDAVIERSNNARLGGRLRARIYGDDPVDLTGRLGR